MVKRIVLLLLLLPVLAHAQRPYQPGASEIRNKLKKLNFLGSVLYVAAHPDDENTRVITYLSKGRLATTGYLSMTRGDGGQNLIGPEIRDLLGLIRTQELLAARRLDGGQQFFTRANDFGFSKSATETFAIWGKDEILSDVVRVFRAYQPDVIITRFPPDERAGHGHHTASAMLAIEAFDVAANREAYPEQLTSSGTWQPTRLFINTGRWWNSTINESTPGVTTIQVGGYNPLLGQSYSEIAAISRSQHKSQGFGSRGIRGEQPEYLEFVKGEKPAQDIFDGINTTWTRVKGGEKVKVLIDQALAAYREDDPSASIPALLQIRTTIASLERNVWTIRKLAEADKLIEDCLGLYAEATADQFWIAPGERTLVNIELVNRSGVAATLESISSTSMAWDTTVQVALKNNHQLLLKTRQAVTAKAYSDPYWLREAHTTGRFTVPSVDLIGKPENDPALTVTFRLQVAGQVYSITKPIVYRWTDPVKGELYRPVEIVPPVFVNITNGVWLFTSNQPRQVSVLVTSASNAPVAGAVKLILPAGWRSEPASVQISLQKREQEVTAQFMVYPSATESNGQLKAVVEMNGTTYDRAVQTINYDHIPIQTLLPPASKPLIRQDLKREGQVVGYIRGAGDDVPAALRNMGYEVWEMKDDEVTPENLKRVDAVVLGVRAVNTNERIGFLMSPLLDYVKNGGTLVMQYNTSGDLETDTFSPFPLTISRDRVTEEDAAVRMLKPDHPLLNYPNKITDADFAGWVQERGLYFPGTWDPQYEALLSMNDTGEKPKDGALLVAKYGSGMYIYTGLSFFRELPEGVPGAYKLFANLVSAGKSSKPVSTKVKNKSR